MLALANATIVSGEQVALLARENASLKDQVSSMAEILATIQSTILGSNNHQPTTSTNTSGGRGGRGTGGRGSRTTPSTRATRTRNNQYDPTSKHYCWSHGLTCTPLHISSNCRTPETGHQRTATFTNRMGGSNFRCSGVANAATPLSNQDE